MKKFALSIVASAMVMAGLSAAVPAQAEPYPGAVPTQTRILSTWPRIFQGQAPAMRVQVKPVSGTTKVRGRLQMTCKRGTVTRKGTRQSYVGNTGKRVVGPTLYGAGFWKCSVRFDGGTSVFADSSAGPRSIQVVRVR